MLTLPLTAKWRIATVPFLAVILLMALASPFNLHAPAAAEGTVPTPTVTPTVTATATPNSTPASPADRATSDEGDTQAQSADLFSKVEGEPPPSTDVETLASRLVDIDFEQLAQVVESPVGTKDPVTEEPPKAQSLVLNLFDDVVFTGIVEHVEPTASGHTLWGSLDGVELGTMTMVVNGSIVVGTVRTLGGVYTIRTTGDGTYVIRQIDESSLPPLGEPLEDDLTPRDVTADSEEGPADDGSVIDVMVVYTPLAKRLEGGRAAIEALIDLLVAETNQAYGNSGVIHRIRLVLREEVDYVEDGDSGIDLGRLQDDSDGYMDHVHDLRDAYAADLVHLLADRGDVGGTAVRRGAFGLTASASALTFAQELGHNMGVRHDRYTSGVPRTGFGYGYVNQRAFEPGAPVSARWRTIMSYNRQCAHVGGFNCTRIPYFSNPDKTYNGDPMGVPVDHPSTGVDGAADGVRGLNERRQITANFRRSSASPTPRVGLTMSPYWLSENGGVTTLTATLHRPSSEDTILTVSVSPSDAVTLSGDGTLIIPAGETVSVDSVTINGVDNDHQTGDSTLTVSATATNMSSQGVFGPESVELTIIDDETTPAVTLSLSPAKVRVGGEPVLVSAALDNRSIAETTVTLSASPAEAVDIAPVDLIIPAGQKESKDFVVVRTMDDGDITESRKSVTVSGAATNPQGVTGPGSVELKIFPDGVAFFADDSISYTFTAGVPAGRVLPKAMNSNGPLTYSLTPTPTNGVTFVSGPPARLIVSATAIVADVSSYTLTVTDGDGDTDTMAVSFTFVEGVCLDSAAVSGYSNPGIVADCEGLLTFMDALRGRRSLNWSEHLPINTWQGVSIAKNRVVGIELSLEDLSGTIPSELVSLSELQFLHLPYNSLTGEIPPELGDLANLQSLDIRANELTGEVPSELGGLGNLNVLRLDTNKLTGEIPSELGGLSNLEELRLSGNALTGEIPPELGGLNNLQVLGLHSNQLTGGIPVWLATLQDLQSLFLDFNSLTGSIPVELSSLTNLQNLDLSENQLTGPIPTGLGDLANLELLELNHNQLTGPVPTELSDLTKLQILGLKSNQLTGPIPTELGDLTKLKVLDILANQLTGPIPAELGNLADLEWLHLSGNQLTGPIPIELGRLANLQYLALSVNQLSGEIPTKLGGLANLRTMGLHENSLTGPIPTELGNLSNLKRLSLNNNELTGPIPPEVVELPNLEELTLKGNRLTGCVPVKLRYVPYTDYKRLDLPFCDVLLEDITIGPGSLIPAFDPYRTDYAVLTSTSRVTVTPVNESNASIRFLDQNGNEIVDADSSQDGHQIDLDTGVTIINIAVTSQDGQTTHTYTIRVADAPGAPTITAVTPGEGYLTISWTAPDDTGGLDIESYDIRYIETAADETVESNWTVVEDVWTATSGDDLQYSITGLTGETPYDIQVRAENAKGIGPWSETLTGTPAAPSVCVTGGAVEDATNTGLTSDCEALLVARDNLAGSGATRSLNWASDTPLSQWYGVVLSGTPERVTQLRLHGQNGNPERGLSEAKLNGTIPPELGRLSDLQVLYLHRNNLTGEVPGTLNSLSKLRLLYLYDNGLTGISDELGPGMTELRRLFAQRNDLTGEIPSGLGSMTNLDWLTLYSNQLTGEIPAELGGLTRLKRLYVHENGLTGEIPKELAGVSSLTHLLLHRNALTGKVSSELGGLTNLEWLSLYDNKLDGSIPSALGDLSSLEVLYLHGNDLTGPIPSELGDLSALTNLWLKDNMLSGEIPRELGDLPSLERVRISGNDFTGCIPAGLTDDEEMGRTSDAESLGLDVCEDS